MKKPYESKLSKDIKMISIENLYFSKDPLRQSIKENLRLKHAAYLYKTYMAQTMKLGKKDLENFPKD